MLKRVKKLLIFISLAIAFFAVAHFALALDVGLDKAAGTGLAVSDPRIIAANIIRIILGFLGIIAVGLIIYAGWLWLTAAGNEEKIERAKKILTEAVIGLIIILSAFAIASFILSRLIGATTGGTGDGTVCDPACPGTQYCCNSSCSDSPCGSGLPPGGETSCDGNALLSGCQAGFCGSDKYCDTDSCTCKARGLPVEGETCSTNPLDTQCAAGQCAAGLSCSASDCLCKKTDQPGEGESCDGDSNLAGCQAVDCADNLVCSSGDNCACVKTPLIAWLSPVGGFCSNNNLACLTDGDCNLAPLTGNTCNLDTANGAEGNFITIGGRYFGAAAGQVIFMGDPNQASDDKVAVLPNSVNPLCASSWQDDQIIAVVPEGAVSGPIKVIDSRNYYDTTDNNRGARLKDFLINNLDRPGICELSPSHGKQDEVINYDGIKLSGVSPYFGNLDNKIAGLGPIFNDSKNGTAKVPNLTTGRTTSFVMKDKASSNFLNFIKDEEPYQGPFISSFDPKEGSAGQYVTINGRGFGNARGASLVYFGDEGQGAASFDFPQICADSIWSDKQVIVKVPAGLTNGSYKITMKIGAWPAVDTALIRPVVNFQFNSALPLKPSLCKIDPILGRAGSEINLWGEYFGVADGNSKIRFQLKHDQVWPLSISKTAWGADNSVPGNKKPDQATTTVHQLASTGPVRAVKGRPELVGNGLNFTVGVCKEAADCGSGSLCCSVGTPYAGQCKVGAVVQDACFPEIKSCVYEWNFSTLGIPGGGCSAAQRQCGSASCCNPGDTCYPSDNGGLGRCDNIACQSPRIICGATCCATGVVSCQNGACPVSGGDCPGQVKCNIPGALPPTSTFNCCNSGQCNQLSGQCSGCSAEQPDQCGNFECCSDVSKCNDTDNDGKTECTDPEACSGYGNQCSDSYFCPNSPGQCSTRPAGGLAETGSCDYSCNNFTPCQDDLCAYQPEINKCVKTGSSCALPKTVNYKLGPADFTGIANCLLYNGENRWLMTVRASCPDGWTNLGGNRCVENGTSCFSCLAGFKCLAAGSENNGICAIDKEICPAGSKCSNADKCVKAESGACECCCRKDQANQDCCAPLQCEGACGAETNPANAKFGLCTGCAKVGATQAQHNAACNCSSSGGKFCDTSGAGGQGVCLDCAQLSAASCSSAGAGACCVDAMKNSACRGGTDTVLSGAPGDTKNYCAYYECKPNDNFCGQGNENKVYQGAFGSVFSTFDLCKNNCLAGEGESCYDSANTTPSCDTKKPKCGSGFVCDPTTCRCKSNAPQFGQTCFSYATTTLTCDIGKCEGFDCLNENGSGPTPPNSCGVCCCDPLNDKCAAPLKCQADKGSCASNVKKCDTNKDGAIGPTETDICLSDSSCAAGVSCILDNNLRGKRGLCCGCSKDSDCGDANTVGCGEDTCCQARPKVADPTVPADGAGNVCRNALIQATFDQPMQTNTFAGNVLVAGDYGLSSCPAGAKYLTAADDATWFEKIKFWLAKAPWFNRLFARQAQAVAGNFCLVAGTVSGQLIADNKTLLEFRPQKVLEPNRKYYVIIKGDSDITDAVNNGALSEAGIGLGQTNTEVFNGVTFKGKIWSFNTLPEQATNSGVCKITRAVIEPAAYLFQTNKNDVNDDDATKDGFDKINDSDKRFTAKALAADGARLNPIPEYSWVWSWSSGSDVFGLPSLAGLPDKERVVRASDRFTEGKSVITAKADVTGSQAQAGESYSGAALAYLMVCANPWPPAKPDGSWAPWRDSSANCAVAGAGVCSNTNFELYYCRDAGGPGTADDLPAILSDTAVIRGQSTNLKCDDGAGSCAGQSKGDACGDGTGKCEVDILKELYFFRTE